jgi:RNA polymerase sigma-70 factor, ECF subfamily
MAISPAERDGTSQGTEALYREHGAAVAGLCRSLLRDRAESEDATQQVFLSAHRALLNGAAPREPRAWLLAVARNECYARFRDRASTPTLTGDAPETATADASVHVLRAGELANVWDEVGRMPPTQRKAFLLREVRGLSYGQVADELSLSGASVRSLLLRARTRLRQRLGEVAAGVGGVPWVQALVRLAAGGDGASPVPAATKAAAVGIGALALAGGGGLVVHHATRTPPQTAAHHRVAPRAHHLAVAPQTVAVAPTEDRPGRDDRGPEVEHRRGRDDGSRGEGKRDRGGDHGSRSPGESSHGSDHDGSDDGTPTVTQASSDGRDGGDGGPSAGQGSSGSGSDGSGGPGPSSGSESGSGGSGSSDLSGSSDPGSGRSGSGGSGDDGGSSGHGG